MKGILRPCRRHLGAELYSRWLGHLCGGCLGLRDTTGQLSRLATNYDSVIISVFVEAQSGLLETTTASRCPLRGFKSAQVISSNQRATELVNSVELLGACASLADKQTDMEISPVLVPLVNKVTRKFASRARTSAEKLGLDPDIILDVARKSKESEEVGSSLEEFLEPTARLFAEVLAHTAHVSGVSSNYPYLYAIGYSYGSLVHLLDGVDDYHDDLRSNRFNPIRASGLSPGQVADTCERLLDGISHNLDSCELVEPTLVKGLFGELDRIVRAKVASVGRVRSTVVALGAVATLGSISGWGEDPRRRPRRFRSFGSSLCGSCGNGDLNSCMCDICCITELCDGC